MIRKYVFILISIFASIEVLAATESSLNTRVEGKRSGLNWEIRTAPIAFLAQWATLDIGYKVGARLSTGPALVKYGARSGNMFLPSLEGQAIGWFANYYLGPANQNGGYTSLHLYQEDYLAHPHHERDGERIKHVGQRVNATLGYRWVRSNFDLLIGGGAMALNHQVDETKFSYSSNRLESSTKTLSTVLPMIEFKTGVRF